MRRRSRRFSESEMEFSDDYSWEQFSSSRGTRRNARRSNRSSSADMMMVFGIIVAVVLVAFGVGIHLWNQSKNVKQTVSQTGSKANPLGGESTFPTVDTIPISIDGPIEPPTETASVALYDINQPPIALWVFEQHDEPLGFFLTGHGDESACKEASGHLLRTMREVWQTEDIVGAGFGFSWREETDSSYRMKIEKMKEEFEKIQRERGGGQVKVLTVDAELYRKTCALIETSLSFGKQAKWQVTVIEHYLSEEESPLLIPFYYVNQEGYLKFRLDEQLLGLPKELLNIANFNQIEHDLSAKKAANEELLKKLEEVQQNLDKYTSFKAEFPIYDCYLTEKSSADIMALEFKYEIRTYSLNFAEKLIDPKTGKEVKSIPPGAYIVHRGTGKTDILKRINEIENFAVEANQHIELERERIKKARMINTEILIDAFLRGWRLSAGEDKENEIFDHWVKEKRVQVWQKILDNLDNKRLRVKKGHLAGIFHQENVIFDVKPIENGLVYEVTPYYVLGGDFIQIVDKEAGVCMFASPYTCRLQ